MSWKKWDRIAILITIIGSSLVLIGWAFEIPTLKSILPDYITMKANTALCLMCVALALACNLREQRLFKILSAIFSLFVILVGVLTLAQYQFGVNFGIDEFLFPDSVLPGARFPPGRLAPVSAVNFILLGFSQLLVISRKRYFAWSQTLTLLAFLISFQALIGYAIGVTYAFGSAFYTQMALHTAGLFSVISLGILYSQKDQAFIALISRNTVGGRTGRRLLAAAMLVPPTVTWLYLQGEKLGYYDADFGTLMRVMGNVLFFMIVIWRTVLALNRAEVAQVSAENSLRESNLILEQKVEERTLDLRNSEGRMRAILDSALDAIVGMDSQGLVNEWNPRAEAMFGWKKEEAVGQRMSDVIMPPQFRPMHEAGLKRFVETGESRIMNRNIEVTAMRRNGETFPIELSISATGTKPNQIFTAFIGDITQRKADEQKLKELNVELAQKAAEARQASELKSFFLANMSHEIRTPINGVIGMAGLALDTELSTKQREFIEIIRSSADNLLGIINDILDLSKIESGKMELETINFEMASLLRDIQRSMAYFAEKKALQLRLEIDPEITLNVIGDPGRLRQVFLNLISNGIKFTEQGEITVRGQKLSDNDTHVTFRFEVQDSGMGVPADKLEKLFRPFSQADDSTSRKFGGTGLGLSICRHLVTLMNGEIQVQSEPDKGSTFWFTIRLEKSRTAVITSSEKNEVLTGPRNLGHILVVEDNPVNQKVALGMIKKLGHRVEVVGNGKEALEALSRGPYNLVLMDCHMPEMDGFEATEQIRKGITAFSLIPVIAMTANALSGDREKCLAAGMNDYISKPVALTALDKVIQKWLPQR